MIVKIYNYYADLERANQEWKTRIMQEWQKTKKMPRKKKKRIRKELALDFAIMQWGGRLLNNPL